MSKKFLWLVMGLSFLQSSFAADADDVDDTLSTSKVDDFDQSFEKNIAAFYEGLKNKSQGGQMGVTNSEVVSTDDSSASDSEDGSLNLQEELEAMEMYIQKLEQQAVNKIQEEVSKCHTDAVGLKKRILKITNQRQKQDFDQKINELLGRVKVLFQKKGKVKKRQEEQCKESELAPLPSDMPYYPPQMELAHKGEKTEYLCGLISQFPKGLSPDRGYVVVNNGFLIKMFKNIRQERKQGIRLLLEEKFAELLFNLSPAENVVITALPANPVIVLSPLLVGQLMRMLITQDEAYRAVFKESWKVAYKNLKSIPGQKSESNFSVNVNAFFKILDNAYAKNEQLTKDLLLGFLYLRMMQKKNLQEREKVVTEYAQGLGLAYTPSYYTEDDFFSAKNLCQSGVGTQETLPEDVEAVLFAVKKGTQSSLFYFSPDQYATYKGNYFPACQENTFRTLLSFILGSPAKKSLDLTVLPPSLKVSLELKKYVDEYGDLVEAHSDTYEKAYLDLVEGRPGITYYKSTGGGQNDYDLSPTTENTVALLKLLFGIQKTLHGSPSDQFIEIMQMLSTPKHTLEVSLIEHDESEDKDTFSIALQVPQEKFTLSGEMSCWEEHGNFSLKKEREDLDLESPCLIKTLFFTGETTGQFVLGLCNMSPIFMVAELLKANVLVTEDQLRDFFMQYSSKFYPDYKHVFLNIDQYRAWTLFDMLKIQQGSNYTKKDENSIKKYVALLKVLKEIGVWPDGLNEAVLQRVVNDCFSHREFLIVGAILATYDFPLNDGGYSTAYGSIFDEIMYNLILQWSGDPQLFDAIMRDFFKNNKKGYFLDYFFDSYKPVRTGTVVFLKIMIDAGLQVPEDKKAKLVLQLQEWEKELQKLRDSKAKTRALGDLKSLQEKFSVAKS